MKNGLFHSDFFLPRNFAIAIIAVIMVPIKPITAASTVGVVKRSIMSSVVVGSYSLITSVTEVIAVSPPVLVPVIVRI